MNILMLFLISYPFNYIYPGSGVRANSIGTFYTFKGPSSNWWNPSVPPGEKFSVSGEWNNLLGLFSLIDVCISASIGNIGITAGYSGFNSGGMPINPEIEDSSTLPESLGTFSETEKAYLLSLNHPAGPLHIGIGFKFYQQDMLGARGIGYGFDMGILYRKNRVSIGCVIKDAGGTSISWNGRVVDVIPAAYIAAISYRFVRENWDLKMESSLLYQHEIHYAIGGELTFYFISLRLGWSSLKGIGSGVGVSFMGFYLNYGVNPTGFGYTHRLGITYSKGGA